MSRERCRFVLILLGLLFLALLTSCERSDGLPKGVVVDKAYYWGGSNNGLAQFTYYDKYGVLMMFDDSAHYYMIGDTVIEIK